MSIREIIERCRRQQQQIPGQLEIPDEVYEEWLRARHAQTVLWATEEEAMQEWRDRTFHPLDLRFLFGPKLDNDLFRVRPQS